MMQFRVVKQAVTDLLGAAAVNRYSTIGYQEQMRPSNKDATVYVFFQSGEFPKSGSSQSGSKRHDITLKVELMVASKAVGDLAALTNVASTDGERATALANFDKGSKQADASWDDLADIIYQLIMAANNQDLGLAVGNVASRWIRSVQKETVIPRGERVVLTGSMDLTCTVEEQVLGVALVPGTEFETDIPVGDDPNDNTGVLAVNPAP